MDFSAWLMAWKRYAMGEHFVIFAWWCLLLVICLPAAAVLKQLSFKQAMAHEEIVAEVACQAQHSGGRARSLGVIYDEVARTGSVCTDAANTDLARQANLAKLCCDLVGSTGKNSRASWATDSIWMLLSAVVAQTITCCWTEPRICMMLESKRVEPTLSRLLRGSRLMDKVCNLLLVVSHMQGLRVSAQVVNQSVGKVARVAAKPTSHTAKVVVPQFPNTLQ